LCPISRGGDTAEDARRRDRGRLEERRRFREPSHRGGSDASGAKKGLPRRRAAQMPPSEGEAARSHASIMHTGSNQFQAEGVCAVSDGRSGPVGSRRRLRFQLRRLRETATLTQEQVAAEMDWSLSKLLRIEAGTSSISTNDLKVMLQLFGIADRQQIQELLDLARTSRRRMWWDSYRDVATPSMTSFLGLEADATGMSLYGLGTVPSLFQTEQYAREALLATPDRPSEERVRRLVELRIYRQREVLGQGIAASITILVDEGVLRRMVGGSEIMAAQLEHLRTLAARPNVDLRVVPFAALWRPMVDGSFQILDFPEPDDPGVLHLESDLAYSQLYVNPDHIDRYRAVFRDLAKASLPPDASLAVVQDALSTL
jgi:transcriptional regulator with XRE-family HTH domain